MKTIPYNIKNFIKKHLPNGSIVSNGNEYLTSCPRHTDPHKHLYINFKTGLFLCYKCGFKGDFPTLASFFKTYIKRVPIKIKEEIKPLITTTCELPKEYIPLYENIGILHQKPLKYLYSREITEQQITQYKIGVCFEGLYAGRIIIPVLTDYGIVSYLGRDYTGNLKPKIMTPHAVPGSSGIKDHVFNLNLALKTRHLILVEGVFDCFSIGIRGAALFGKTATKHQLAQIRLSNPLRITVALDPDAEKEAIELAKEFYPSCNDIRIAHFPFGYDCSSIGKEKAASIIEAAPVFDPDGWVV